MRDNSYRPPFVLPPYNGFSAKERYAVIPIQKDGFRSGKVSALTECCVCGPACVATRAGEPLVLHCEDYDRPLEGYPICKPVHRALHGRFTYPERWHRVLRQFGRPGLWINQLSLDPASQFAPFRDTYPNGLPPSTATRTPS